MNTMIQTADIPADAAAEAAPAAPAEHLPTSSPAYAELFYQSTQHSVALGRRGQLRLHPDVFWLPVSEYCNLACIGCDDVISGFRKEYLQPAEVRRLLDTGGGGASFGEIDLTAGEPLLHPQLAEVIDICHELHPNAVVSAVSNGTVPVRGKYREAYGKLDSIGLSMDGATAEVFESVRKGASFERFCQTVQDVVALRDTTGHPAEVQLCFTACALNLHELAEVVRLGKRWGVDSVYAQTMEMNIEPIREAIGHLHLDRMDPALRTRLVDEAVAVAAELGVEFAPSEGLYPLPDSPEPAPEPAPPSNGPSLAFEQKVAALGVGVTRRAPEGDTALTLPHVRQCQYPWTQAPAIRKAKDHWQLTLCCFMTEATNRMMADRYGMSALGEPAMLDIYNGPGYWQFREDLAAGLTRDACGDCAAALTHSPSILQHLTWRMDALCKEHGLSFPGGLEMRERLMTPHTSLHPARRLLNLLHQTWWQQYTPRPVWLRELMDTVRALAPPPQAKAPAVALPAETSISPAAPSA